jgi:transcriptional regulator with XRE-family HTH domain
MTMGGWSRLSARILASVDRPNNPFSIAAQINIMTDPPLPDLIRAAIAADGRPIRQIAIAAGLDSRTVQRYASGERDLTSERLGRLMGALGLRVVATEQQTGDE